MRTVTNEIGFAQCAMARVMVNEKWCAGGSTLWPWRSPLPLHNMRNPEPYRLSLSFFAGCLLFSISPGHASVKPVSDCQIDRFPYSLAIRVETVA